MSVPIRKGLLAVDPSIRSVGAALFVGEELVHAADITCPACNASSNVLVAECEICSQCDGARVTRMAQAVLEWVAACGVVPTRLAAEWPVIRRAGKSVGNPNQMVPMAGMVGAVAGMLALGIVSANCCLTVQTYRPDEWTRGVPKAKPKSEAQDSPRARRIARELSEDELGVYMFLGHDGVDAVGIGLHDLGRLEPRRALRGAT